MPFKKNLSVYRDRSMRTKWVKIGGSYGKFYEISKKNFETNLYHY